MQPARAGDRGGAVGDPRRRGPGRRSTPRSRARHPNLWIGPGRRTGPTPRHCSRHRRCRRRRASRRRSLGCSTIATRTTTGRGPSDRGALLRQRCSSGDDRPERDRRFRAWLDGLTPDDALVIVGDLCDFWMAARQGERRLAGYPSLQALADFRRRGGRWRSWPAITTDGSARSTSGPWAPRSSTSRPTLTVRSPRPDGPRPPARRPAALEGVDGEPRVLRRIRGRARPDRPGRSTRCWLRGTSAAPGGRRAPPPRLSRICGRAAAARPISSSSAMSTAR